MFKVVSKFELSDAKVVMFERDQEQMKMNPSN